MPPLRDSRYEFCRGITDADGNLTLTERKPYRFRALPDTRVHIVQTGDSLFVLAGHYYRPKPRACGFWWVIADFQPDPVIDPTLALQPGRHLYIPSLRVLDEEILRPRRGQNT